MSTELIAPEMEGLVIFFKREGNNPDLHSWQENISFLEVVFILWIL